MTRSRFSTIAVACALCSVSCGRSSSPSAKTTPIADRPGTVHIERVPDAEAVLAQLGRTAWVFKHRGGELTSEFTISHRPEGKDQKQAVIFRTRSDDAIVMHYALDRAGKKVGEGGYLIVAIPRSLSSVKSEDGTITHSLSVGKVSVIENKPADELIPQSVLSHSGIIGGASMVEKEPTEVAPGETKELVWVMKVLHTLGSELPYDQREMVLYTLTVTALKDGQLPERDDLTDE